jgi:Ca2+-binding EF-hand superfamily protein
MKEVKNFLKDNGPYEVFDSFDKDKDDGLDIDELNNLFKACSPTLNQNK